ncbi:uracil-DNA glycosylase [Ferrimonas marina]|uniref:Uracil-DNA glycosylase n=1 Tax=Ferrimonas marina TaxID=299255 RepID=A0A1M5VXP0_9GAMM|nr:uracil-DNA glycosylase [Ferrimonas marina]SHH79971.1 Uracil-DNA glycosylase [Ferrimonas marina]
MPVQNQWGPILAEEQAQPYFRQMMTQLAQWRSEGQLIYPPEHQVFEAFQRTDFDQVKVVILGQDPYHGPNQAHGLCFSVAPGIKPPPSLVNIYKALAQEFPGFELPEHGYLGSWADQGVLLLNTVLTVVDGQAHSHAKLGWERFTDAVIEAVNREREGVVFLLWGSHAQKKGKGIDRSRHHVLDAPHPSPLSAYRGFFDCGHFTQTNALLQQQGLDPIDWQPRLPQ